MKTVLKVGLIVWVLAGTEVMFGAGTPVGVWTNGKRENRVEIVEGEDGVLTGRIVWLFRPNKKDGTAKRDENNPEEKLRTRGIVGMVFLEGFKAAKKEGRWEGGTIYDPRKGKTYKSYIQMVDENTIELRGYIGMPMMGRSENWTRVKGVMPTEDELTEIKKLRAKDKD